MLKGATRTPHFYDFGIIGCVPEPQDQHCYLWRPQDAFNKSRKAQRLLLKHVDFPYLLAGCIYPGNIQDILKEVDPLGVDMASGVEEEGSVSSEKIERLMRVL